MYEKAARVWCIYPNPWRCCFGNLESIIVLKYIVKGLTMCHRFSD